MLKNKNIMTRKQILLLQILMLAIVLSVLPLLLHGTKTKDLTQSIPAHETQKDTVLAVRVIDGDTFVDEHGRKIRLIGIDAPEMNYKSGSPECMALEAKLKLQELIERKKVKLERDKSNKDRYGRLLRYAYLEDGTFVNAKLVKAGLAKVKYYKPDTSKYKELKTFEYIAKQQKLGIFSCGTDGNL